MLVSIIIPSYNRCQFLAKLIESLLTQKKDDRFSFEILVVDDASTDGTKTFIRELEKSCGSKVRLAEAKGDGVASARNMGIMEAQGEWIAFTDDDQVAQSTWLVSLVDVALGKKARCVAGKRLLLLPDPINIPLNTRLRTYFGEEIWGEETRPLLPEEFPNTGNVLLKKDLFDERGFFDGSFRYGGEDSEFFFRLKKAGVPIWYAPEAVMYHFISEDRLNERYLRSKALRDGISKAMLYQKHGLYGKLATGLFKWCLLAMARRQWFFQQKCPAGKLNGKYIGWHTWGYLSQTLAFWAPDFFKRSRFFRDLQFRKIHKKGR